ncbi:MAG: DUF342 domain-containing protein [Acidobacteria bacterium]|nr:DUF342 domain-containing protein [Acidobacteriota bacterium]
MSDPDALEEPQDPGQSQDSNSTAEIDPGTPIPSCLRFTKRGADENLLFALVEPSQEAPLDIAVSEFRWWVRRQGCEGWLFKEETIWQLSREVRKLDKAKEYFVAERTDCKVEIQVAADRLKAWIRVLPAYGGIRPTEALIKESLADHRICFGINESLIQQIVQNGQCDREVIAEGAPPTPGEPVRFEPLVHESEHKGIPQEQEYGRVDYKDLGLFLSVTPGTPLLKHIPPTTGLPGTGIDGVPIPAPSEMDRLPHAGIGTALSKEDPDIVVAARAGQPYFFDNSVRVDPTLEIDIVGPSTGNVIFEGNIIVRGPVESGYEVKAGQDLSILDTVEGARLTAGRNMVLLTGIYGKNKSEISAEGNIEARFISDCSVHCGGNLEVSDLIAHCEVECEGILSLGKNGGKGQMYGGHMVAMRGVFAQILGSVSEMSTLVELAPPRDLVQRLVRIEDQIEAARKTLEIVEKHLHPAGNSSPPDEDLRTRNYEEKAAGLRQTLAELTREQAILQEKENASRHGRIKAAVAYRGVTLRIGKARESISELTHGLDFREPIEEKPSQSS